MLDSSKQSSMYETNYQNPECRHRCFFFCLKSSLLTTGKYGSGMPYKNATSCFSSAHNWELMDASIRFVTRYILPSSPQNYSVEMTWEAFFNRGLNIVFQTCQVAMRRYLSQLTTWYITLCKAFISDIYIIQNMVPSRYLDLSSSVKPHCSLDIAWFLLLTGDPVLTCPSAAALVSFNLEALGRSNGLLRSCAVFGTPSLSLLPGVAKGSTEISLGSGCASGSVQNMASNFSTTSPSRSGWVCKGFVAMCFLCDHG